MGVYLNLKISLDRETYPLPDPEPPIPTGNRYGIIRHRKEWEPTWPESLGAGDMSLPETCRQVTKPGSYSQIPVLPAMWKWLEATNSPAALKYLQSVGKMWINAGYIPGVETPRAESITNCHNFVRIIGETLTEYRIASFPHNQDLLATFDPALHNWYTMPDMIWKAIATNPSSYHINPADNLDVFIPYLKYGTEGNLYIPREKVELFSELPVKVTVATALNIRNKPGTAGDIVGQYPAGGMAWISEYKPLGASVWGRTERGWVCLLIADLPKQRVCTTDWRLDTIGVIPPG